MEVNMSNGSRFELPISDSSTQWFPFSSLCRDLRHARSPWSDPGWSLLIPPHEERETRVGRAWHFIECQGPPKLVDLPHMVQIKSYKLNNRHIHAHNYNVDDGLPMAMMPPAVPIPHLGVEVAVFLAVFFVFITTLLGNLLRQS